jgi:hypothetical protein
LELLELLEPLESELSELPLFFPELELEPELLELEPPLPPLPPLELVLDGSSQM